MDFARGVRASKVWALVAGLAAVAAPAFAAGEGSVTLASRTTRGASGEPATFQEATTTEESLSPPFEPTMDDYRPCDTCGEEACCDAGCGCGDCSLDCCRYDGNNWYVSVSGGWQQRERVHEITAATTFLELDGGFALNAALGHEFDHFRVEFEATLLNNEIDEAGAGGLSSDTVGNINVRAYMFNVYHDIHIECSRWKPYLGGGIGTAQSEINGLYPEFFNTIGPPFEGTALNCTSDFVFAWQLRAGTSYCLTPRTELTIGYRYFRAETLEFSSAPFVGATASAFNPNGSTNHSVEIGLRVKF